MHTKDRNSAWVDKKVTN